MGFSNTNSNNPFRKPSKAPERDEWEDWDEDERPGTIILDDDDLSYDGQMDSLQRYSVQRPIYRAKSKGHTKAKIAKAGITLDTNVFKSRQTPRLSRRSTEQSARPENAGRFADAAALKALEGSPNSASIGSFSWLKRKHGNLSAKSAKSSPLSPESRPIVIGIAMPSDTASEHQVSPQTAVVETPMAVQHYNQRLAAQKTGGSVGTPVQLRSVWSPDTEATESPYSSRAASSVYSQITTRGGVGAGLDDAPPVPTLPATYKFKQNQQQALVDLEEDETGTPCTLFEEDGSPSATRKSMKPISAISPEGTGKSKGWWDTVRISQQTNMSPQSTNPFRQTAQQTGESSSSAVTPRDWWHETNEKMPNLPQSNLTIMTAAVPQQTTGQSSRSVASSSQQPPVSRIETQSEKSHILLEENRAQTPIEQPPPYSLNEVKYGVVLPPNHFVNSQPIPSPGPVSPGLPGTMTSQGAIMMSDVPLTPRRAPTAVLPERPVGTYVSHDQFQEAPGTNFRTERNRRRHEKEEFAARKVGGYWRGRGCVPAEGCFGRTGREGRKRRRVCLAIFGGVLALIILIVVLAVVLTRKSMAASHDVPQSPAQSPEVTSAPIDTVWLNLTDFPPMPTGVLTVSGPDNSETTDNCLADSAKTLWSCSIPKDQQEPKALYKPDQPEFIFQIQFDNNTRALWNISDTGEQPSQTDSSYQGDTDIPKDDISIVISGRRSIASAVARAAAFVRRAVVYDTGFSPNPAPPEQAEMFFLGNTTDNIESDGKAGEPTPFFISLLSTIEGTVGPDVLSKRGIGNGIDSAPTNGSASQNVSNFVDAPINSDGTPLPATLFPLPSQQPVRLYDRGLPTEHYGFYTYFNKSIYIFDQDQDNATDQDGGALLEDATALIVWFQARFLVKMWTRLDSELLGNGTLPGTDGTSVSAQPGTMPYPVTVIEDIHGGDKNTKTTAVWNIGANGRVDTSSAKLVTINKGAGGTLINALNDADNSLGGIDGGTGGCRCEWINFVDTS